MKYTKKLQKLDLALEKKYPEKTRKSPKTFKSMSFKIFSWQIYEMQLAWMQHTLMLNAFLLVTSYLFCYESFQNVLIHQLESFGSFIDFYPYFSYFSRSKHSFWKLLEINLMSFQCFLDFLYPNISLGFFEVLEA